MSTRRIFVLLALLFLFSCRTVQPPSRPVAGFYPTVDVSRRLDDLQACTIAEQQLRDALQSMHIWELLQAAGMEDKESALICRGLGERGYAELDARRAGSPLHWVTFASPDGKNLEISAAFLNAPPPRCRFDVMLEKKPNRQEGRKIIRNRKTEYQYLRIWGCPMNEGNSLEIWNVSGESRKDKSYWEVRRSFLFQ
ncbi:MAG: hypothetical protein WCT05_02565 [Lentisphaeria bacterium]